MSTSLDRKIEAAKLRAEAERKQAGGPATPDEVVAFESGRAVTAEQANMRARNLLDKMPVAKPYASHVVGEHRTIDSMIGAEVAGTPRMGADKDREMAAWHAQRVEGIFFNAVNPPVIVDLSIKESTLKAIEPLILEIGALRESVSRLQQECDALRREVNAHFQGPFSGSLGCYSGVSFHPAPA